jgi:hypothetical protein
MPTTGIDNATGKLAQPSIDWVGRCGELAYVDARGDWDRDAYRQLERCVDSILDGTAVTAMLTLDVQQADWPSTEAHRVCEALRRLHRRMPVWAFVDGAALGFAYTLAASCSGIIATPASRLGLLAACDDGASVLLRVMAREGRSQTTDEALEACEQRILSGELAESRDFRLVDGLADPPERFLSQLFFTESRGLLLTPIN